MTPPARPLQSSRLPREALPVRIDGGPLIGQTRLRPNEAHELIIQVGRHRVHFSQQQLNELVQLLDLHRFEVDVDARGPERLRDATKRLGAG